MRGKRATRSGLSWMTAIANTANASRSHATARSRSRNQLSSSGVLSVVAMVISLKRYCVLLFEKSPGAPILVALAHQQEGRFEAVVDFEFVEDVGQVGFDGLFTDENFLADLFVGKAFGD